LSAQAILLRTAAGASLLIAAAPAAAHDFSTVPLYVAGIAVLQALPLLWLVAWRIPRAVMWHLIVLLASWPIAVGGLFALNSSWPLLALIAPWATLPLFAAAKRRNVNHAA